MPEIGVNIARIRTANGLSREAFAAKLGVTSDKVKNVENSKQRVDHEFLLALREQFDVDLNSLIDKASASGDGQIIPAQAGTSSEFFEVPRFSVEAAAGAGALPDGEETTGFYAFNKKWLARRGLTPANLAVISVRGDSMEPRLSSGDLILIDRAQRQIVDGLAFVVRLGTDLVVKHVQRISPDAISLISANRMYPPREVALSDLDSDCHQIEIIGRVVASMHEW